MDLERMIEIAQAIKDLDSKRATLVEAFRAEAGVGPETPRSEPTPPQSTEPAELRILRLFAGDADRVLSLRMIKRLERRITNVSPVLTALVRDRMVERVGRGKYRLVHRESDPNPTP